MSVKVNIIMVLCMVLKYCRADQSQTCDTCSRDFTQPLNFNVTATISCKSIPASGNFTQTSCNGTTDGNYVTTTKIHLSELGVKCQGGLQELIKSLAPLMKLKVPGSAIIEFSVKSFDLEQTVEVKDGNISNTVVTTKLGPQQIRASGPGLLGKLLEGISKKPETISLLGAPIIDAFKTSVENVIDSEQQMNLCD